VNADDDEKTRAFADMHWAAPAESMALLRADSIVLRSVRGHAMLGLFEAAPAEYVAWIRGLRTDDDSGPRAQADLIEVATAEFVAFQRSSNDPGPALANLVEVAPSEYVAWLRADSDSEHHALANLIEAALSEHLKYIRARGDTGLADETEIAAADLIEAAAAEYVAMLRADNDAEVRSTLVDLKTAAPAEYAAWIQASQAVKDPDLGLSRSKPYPFGTVATPADWQFEALQVLRGERAWRIIQEAYPSSSPPPANMEQLLVEISATYTGSDQGHISISDFGITGSSGVLWPYTSFASGSSRLALEATLLNGGRTQGWVSFEINQDEKDLILVFSKANLETADILFQVLRFGFTGSLDEIGSVPYYLALEPGSRVAPDEGLSGATDLGRNSATPVPVGSRATTSYFQVEIKESIRGDEAWNILKAARDSNDPPDPGMEYLLALVRVRNISSLLVAIDDDAFRSVGDRRTVWKNPFVTEPEPSIKAALYPGGVHQGWVALQVAEREDKLVAVFEHTVGYFDIDRRYLTIP